MKCSIKITKKTGVLFLLAIFTLFGATDTKAMLPIIKSNPQLQRRIEKGLQLTKKEEKMRCKFELIKELRLKNATAREEAEKKGWYVYGSEGENYPVLIDEELLKSSETIKNMFADIDYDQKIAIPLPNFSTNTIKQCFDIVKLYNKQSDTLYGTIKNLSFNQLLTMTTCIDHLALPTELRDIFLPTIREHIATDTQHINSENFTKLNPELQKLLLIKPVVNYLKNEIIKKDTQKTTIKLVGHSENSYSRSVAFHPDGTRFVSGSEGNQNNLILWDARTGKQICKLIGHPKDVKSVEFSPDGTKIVSSCNDNQSNLIVWDAKTGKQIFNLAGHLEGVLTATFSPNSKKIVSGSEGDQNNLIVWDAITGNQLFNLAGHPKDVTSAVFSPNSRKILSGCSGDQNNLILWDAITGKQLFNLVGHPNDVHSVAFSPDGTNIASGSWGSKNNLIVWNAKTGQLISTFVGHPGYVKSVAFSPDSTNIASAAYGKQNNLILWNAITGQLICNCVGHPGYVKLAAFSSDGTNIVSISYGNHNNFIVWDAKTGQKLFTLVDHPETIMDSVAFSPDGTQIVSCCRENKNNLILLLTLLTDAQKVMLNTIDGYSADKVRLLYQLCLQSSKGSVKSLEGNNLVLFRELPTDIQQLLSNYLLPKN